MNKNTLIGFLLIAAILFGWMYFMSPSKEEIAERQRVQDSIRQARMIELAQADSLKEVERQERDLMAALQSDTIVMDSTTAALQQQLVLKNEYGVFASSAQGSEQQWTIENKLQKLTFSSKGGFLKKVELKDYKTYDSLPLIMFDTATVKFDLVFFVQSRDIHTSNLYFQPFMDGQPYQGGDMTVGENDSIVLTMRLFTDDAEKYIDYVYTVHDNNYMLDFDIRTVGMNDVIASNASYLNIDWDVDLMKQEKSTDRFAGESVYYRAVNGKEVEHLNENKDGDKVANNKLQWVSFRR